MAAPSFYRPQLVYTERVVEYDCNDLAEYLAARLRASGVSLPSDPEPQDLREALAGVHLLPLTDPAAERLLTTGRGDWPRIVLTDRRRQLWEQLLKTFPLRSVVHSGKQHT